MFAIKKHLVYNKCLFGGLFMHENNWQVDLSKISSEFNNETMRYRINSFAYSCGMNDIDVISNAGVLSKNKENGEHSYHIVAERQYEEYDDIYDIGYKIINLYGKYDDLNFCFTNLIHYNENLSKKNKYLRFAIKLKKEFNADTYLLVISPVNGEPYKFKYTFVKKTIDNKLNKKIDVSECIKDFDKVLLLVKLFVDNPQLVYLQLIYELYNEKNKSGNIIPSQSLIDRLIMKVDREDTQNVKRKSL